MQSIKIIYKRYSILVLNKLNANIYIAKFVNTILYFLMRFNSLYIRNNLLNFNIFI